MFDNEACFVLLKVRVCENVTGETTQCGKFSTTIGRSLPDRKFLQALDNRITHTSRGMQFPSMWHFDKCRLIRACPNNVQSVA